MNINWTRVITGLAIALGTILLVFVGGIIFALSVSLVAVLSILEFYKLTINDFTSFKNLLLIILGLLNALILVLTAHFSIASNLILIMSFNIIGVAFLSITVFKSNTNFIQIIMNQMFGLIYIPISLSFLVVIRNYDYGLFWSFMILSIVVASDTGAYYIGSFLGRYKLCPSISPKKTLEGSIGGLFCSIIVAITLKFYLFSFLSVFKCVILACALGISGQIGDLFASQFKRVAGVKDSGSLLPGHGGLLDRIDAVLLAIPVAYLFRFYVFS